MRDLVEKAQRFTNHLVEAHEDRFEMFQTDSFDISIPQTELAMRGSYGVGLEGGYGLSVDAVALAPGRFVL